MRLKDKVSVVTGSASGIGRAISQAFAAEGSKVVVCDVDVPGALETVAAIRSAGGVATFCECDVSVPEQVEALFRHAADNFGKVDVICNNAGIFTIETVYDITKLSVEVWDRILDVNLKGVFLCCKYGIPYMLRSGGGSIIHISSTASFVASERAAYAASKGGIESLSKAIARQFAKAGIRSNVICPAAIQTGARKATEKQDETMQFPNAAPLLPRMAHPDEVGPLAVFLASDESSFLTGTAIPIDGGVSAR